MKKINPKKVETFSAKAIKWVKALWSKYVLEPRNEKKRIQKEIDDIKELKKNFKKQFGIDAEHVKNEIAKQKNFSGVNVEQTDENHLMKKLVEARKALNENTSKKSPLFYVPEVCDIHNENEFKWTSHSIDEIKKHDYEEATKVLENDKNRKLANRAKFLWRTRM